MYKTFMLIALPVLAIGWIAYALWMRMVLKEEKNRPKPQSQRLTKTKSEVSDWAKKMAAYQPPKIKRKYDDEESEDQQQDNPNKPE
jgi:hypothetical protein